MATLEEIFALKSNTNLRNRVVAAIAKAAEAVRNEAAARINHAERFAWAINTLASETGPATEAKRIFWMIAQNATIADGYTLNPNGSTVTDGDIEFTVNGLVDFMAGVDTSA
jgi:hypothetical protein